MKNQKIFTIGGATFDIFVKTNDQAVMSFATPDKAEKYLCLKHGGKVKVEHVIETFGGGATNTGVAFARMGFDSSFVGKIGEEYGDKVLKNLKDNGVNTDFVKCTDKDKTAFSTIISTFDGDRTVLAYAGANRFFNEKDLPVKELSKADWIFFNHLAEGGGKISDVLLNTLKKHPAIKMAWNPGREQFEEGVKKWKELLKHTTILFVNKEEAALFTKIPYRLAGIKREDPKFHVHMLRDFLPPYADDVSEIMLEFFKYGVKNVVITDGRHGAQVSDGKRLYFCPVVSTVRKDTLGAGDAFASGFTSAMILGETLKTALAYGTLNANSVVNFFGAQKGLLTRSEMKKKLKSVDLQITSTELLR